MKLRNLIEGVNRLIFAEILVIIMILAFLPWCIGYFFGAIVGGFCAVSGICR